MNLHGRDILIVGGGVVALRKAEGLADTGANLLVMAPRIAAEFSGIANVTLMRQEYDSSIMPGTPRFTLIFAATSDTEVNGDVANDAMYHGILCLRVDHPEEGDFSNGAVHQQRGVTLAVSTHGASPLLAGRIRDEMGRLLDPALLQWSGLFSAWRPAVLRGVRDAGERREILRRLGGADMEKIIREAGVSAAEEAGRMWIRAANSFVDETRA